MLTHMPRRPKNKAQATKRPYVRRVVPPPEPPTAKAEPKPEPPMKTVPTDDFVTTIAVDPSFALRVNGNVRAYKMPVQAVIDFCATYVCHLFESQVPADAPLMPAKKSARPEGGRLPIGRDVLGRFERLARQLDRPAQDLLREAYLQLRGFFEKTKFPVDREFIAARAAVGGAVARTKTPRAA